MCDLEIICLLYRNGSLSFVARDVSKRLYISNRENGKYWQQLVWQQHLRTSPLDFVGLRQWAWSEGLPSCNGGLTISHISDALYHPVFSVSLFCSSWSSFMVTHLIASACFSPPFPHSMKVKEGKSSLRKVFLCLALYFLPYSQPSLLLLKIEEFLCNVFNSTCLMLTVRK